MFFLLIFKINFFADFLFYCQLQFFSSMAFVRCSSQKFCAQPDCFRGSAIRKGWISKTENVKEDSCGLFGIEEEEDSWLEWIGTYRNNLPTLFILRWDTFPFQVIQMSLSSSNCIMWINIFDNCKLISITAT